MAPITLFSANSSGKSSIGQFLMMLKQTVELPDRRAVFYPGGPNSAIQLGSYHEMVYGRDPSNIIEFEYQWFLQEALNFEDPISEKSFSGNELRFSAEIGLKNNQSTPVLSALNTSYRMCKTAVYNWNRKQMTTSANQLKPKLPLDRKQGRWQPGAPGFLWISDEVVAYHQNADFVQELNLQHEKLFRSLYYIGPLRTKAGRLYTWSGTEPDSVGFAGENAVGAMLAARGRNISLGPRKRNILLEKIIAMKLIEMGLIEEFEIKPISDQRQEYEVKVRTKLSTDWVDLPDVGFGISQVLPVLVQCFYAPPGSIILMEQPEIHLHPSAQSALADVMIDVIKSREDYSDRNIQLVIETHSEHFLRRLQRRIAEKELEQDKVSAYFANVSSKQPGLEPLDIDSFGNIRNWPEHFFGDEMGDITEQAKWALKRRLKQETVAPSE